MKSLRILSLGLFVAACTEVIMVSAPVVGCPRIKGSWRGVQPNGGQAIEYQIDTLPGFQALNPFTGGAAYQCQASYAFGPQYVQGVGFLLYFSDPYLYWGSLSRAKLASDTILRIWEQGKADTATFRRVHP